MRGLTIVVASTDAERFGSACTLASAHAALGGRTRLYLHDAAVRVLTAEHRLLATAQELGVAVIACQTGLAAQGVALPAGTEGGGMVSLLADLGDDRLIVV
nr:peroxiredoxin [Sphingomonas guangdongensis]